MKILPPLTIDPESTEYGAFILSTADELDVDDEVGGHEPFLVGDVGTNVPEDDEPLWAPGFEYERGYRVMWLHRIYEAAADIDDDAEPGTPAAEGRWLDMGATNRWRLFDRIVGSKTTNPESIELSILPGQPVNAIAMFGLDAASIEISVIDPYRGTIYRTSTVPTSRDNIHTFWDWFFAPLETREDIILTGIPATAYSTIQIRILKPGGAASIGELVLGTMIDLGCTQYGATVGIRDFSRKETDPFGNFIVVPRGYSKRGDFDVRLDTAQVSFVQRTLAEYRATPVVWIGSEAIEATVIYGYFRDFQIVIPNNTKSDCSISVEGLT